MVLSNQFEPIFKELSPFFALLLLDYPRVVVVQPLVARAKRGGRLPPDTIHNL